MSPVNPLNPKKSSEKLQIIDLVRSVSILTVMALHLKPTLPLPSPLFRWAWDHFQRNGAYGVSIFFVISGFLITRLIDRQKEGLLKPVLRVFYIRRAARIFPLLFFVILAGLFFTYDLDDSSRKFYYCFKNPGIKLTPLFWVSLSTFSYNWFQVLNPLGYPGIYWAALWSLSIEEQFYLFYPLVLRKLKSLKNLAWVLGGIIVTAFIWRGGIYWLGIEGSAPSLRGSFGAFDQIAFGALLYLASQKFQDYLGKRPAACILLCGAGFLTTTLTYLGTSTAESLDLVYGPFLIALGVSCFLLGGLHLPFFEARPLRLLALPGKYSYGNYLFNALVLYLIHPLLWNLNIAAAFALFVLATTCLSAVSFHFFETPANQFTRRYFRIPIN